MASTQPTKPGPQPVRRLSYFHEALALLTVDFPIYYIESISERHVVIAGGGGSSKTGVHNQLNVIELVPSNGSCYSELVARYHDIPDAIMTGSLMRDSHISEKRLVTSGTHPVIYQLVFNPTNRLFEIETQDELKDFKPRNEAKCVKCLGANKILAGGIDGQLTCWDGKKVISDIKAHSKEIDVIDVDPINEHIVTLSRGEGRFAIWSLNSFELIKEFHNKDMNRTNGGNGKVSYCLRSCKFAMDTTNSKGATNFSLLIACNPIPAKGQLSLIRKIAIKNDDLNVVAESQPISGEGIMALTVRSDGKYAAIGTRSGGVAVFDVKNLRQIYCICQAHHNLVTDLDFLPPQQESLTLTNSELCPLLSVSIDRRVVLHRPKAQSSMTKWTKILLIMLVIYLLFFALQKHLLRS